MKKERVLITSALLYANGPLHFGHLAGAYLPADCYARFKRLKGDDVLFISGSDEYGVAITLSAELANRSPKEHIDLFHEINRKLFKRMNISFNHYSRTTCKEHAPIVQQFFLELHKNGYLEEKECPELYSEEEKRFLADRYVTGTCPKCGFLEARGDECPKCGGSYEATDLKDPRSKITGSKLSLKKTTHWFLRCELFKEKLLDWLDTRDWKPTVTNFIKPYIEDLRPRAITRDSSWGVPLPLPGTEGKVLYVWFDAPIGYISATQEWANIYGDREAWKKYWCEPETKYVEFIGKDNIVFHAMFFPAMTMGQSSFYKLVDGLPANEFFNLEGKKFSKSSGWYVDLVEFLDKYPVDTLRYTIAANAPESQDSEFTFKDFQMRVNTELVGKFGNFIHRTLSFISTRMDQKIPECYAYEEEDNTFLAEIRCLASDAANAYEHFHLRKATQVLMEIASLSNAYFDKKKPWVLIKDKEKSEALLTTMYSCLTAIETLALVAFPIIPESAEKIWKMLGFKSSLETQKWQEVLDEELIPGTELPHPEILFTKIEDSVIEDEINKLQSTLTVTDSNIEPFKEAVTYDDFMKMDLRVGKILSAEPVPKSSKLLKLFIDLGFEKRTIVSGIAKHFENLEALVGQKVIVVANLKPAKLMGIESQGMVLAASDGTLLELPFLTTATVGSTVC